MVNPIQVGNEGFKLQHQGKILSSKGEYCIGNFQKKKFIRYAATLNFIEISLMVNTWYK